MSLAVARSKILRFFSEELGCPIISDKSPMFLNSVFPTTVALTATLGTKRIFGFGTDADEGIAKAKAAMELLERYLFWIVEKRSKGNCDSSTNGLALHLNLNSAKEGALSELVERHVILKAMLHNISPLRLGPTRISRTFGFRSDLHPEIFLWSGPFRRTVAIARYAVLQKNCYGFGADVSATAAIEKAASEASTRIGFALSTGCPREGHPESENFETHFHHRHEWIENWLNCSNANEPPEVDANVPFCRVSFTDIPLPSLFRDSIFAIRASSSQLQPLFVGPWDSSRLWSSAVGTFDKFPPVMHLVG